MADWVELLERQEREQRREKVHIVGETPPAPTKSRKSLWLGEAAALAAIVVLVGGSLWWLSSSLGTQDAAQPSQPTSQASQTPESLQVSPADEKDRVLVTGSAGCRAGADQISKEQDSLRAAIVEFEDAYFSHDVERLADSLADDSALRNQDWKKVLSSEVPEGTAWCVEISPPSGTTADMDLRMKIPGGDESVFQQVVTGEKTDAGWRISTIEPRKDK